VWLYRHLPTVAGLAARLFYRLTTAGEKAPAAGPALLVANHPGALMDPVLVAAVAGRPVRFLAKAPLFDDWRTAWAVRGAGAVPVHRRQDDPGAASRNREMFAAVETALAEGAAVALFPEGVSHDAPALAPLRTGAARIALGAAVRLGQPIPIHPVGLVFREKETFRSGALAVIGAPVAWDDLAGRGPENAEAVHELTRRIDGALRAVTLNLARWEDAELVECAEAVWAVEYDAASEPAARLTRLRATSELLARGRAANAALLPPLVRAVRRHAKMLRHLGLAPADLHVALDGRTALRWTLRRLPLLALPLLALAAAGLALWWPPYRVVGSLAQAARPSRDVHATYKFGAGLAVFTLWVVLLSVLAAATWGALAAVGVLLGLPLSGLAALAVVERWEAAWLDARRFFLLRSNPDLLRRLRHDQRELAERLDAYLRQHDPSAAPHSATAFAGRASQQKHIDPLTVDG